MLYNDQLVSERTNSPITALTVLVGRIFLREKKGEISC